MEPDVIEHTHDKRCPQCPGEHGGPGPCDMAQYTARYRRFLAAHWEELEAAYLSPNPATARNVHERQAREWVALPRGHVCTCWCPMERPGRGERIEEGGKNAMTAPRHPPCPECQVIRAQRAWDPIHALNDVGDEVGRHGSPAHAPMPSPTCLDVATGYAAA